MKIRTTTCFLLSTMLGMGSTMTPAQTKFLDDHKRWTAFHDKVSANVKTHPVVVHNQYTTDFALGTYTIEEQKYFTQQFSVFSQWFLMAQLTKIINAPTLSEMRDGKEILCNELGVGFRPESGSVQNGIFRHEMSHYEWLIRFAKGLDLDYHQLGKRCFGSDTTLLFCDELMRLYGSDDDATAIAASYAVENWAQAGFWDQLTEGFEKINLTREGLDLKPLPLSFWKHHAKLEAKHAKHTADELKTVYLEGRIKDEDAFMETCDEMLNAVEIFWKGLDNN